MIWWLRARRAGWVAAVAVVGGALAWASASGRAVDGAIVSPIRAGAAVPVVLWLPMAFASALCWALAVDEGADRWAAVVRRNRRLVGSYVVAATVLAGVCLGPALLASHRVGAGVARNAVGLVGITLVLRRRVGGSAAAAVAAGYVVGSALLGAQPHGGAEWWAWPAADRVGPTDLALAGACFGAGMIAVVGRAD